MSKKINQLDAANSTEAKNDNRVYAFADPTTGLSKKVTVSQLKEVFSPKSLIYTATGSEGVTLTIASLAGYQILSIMRESGPIFEVGSSPASNEYTWDDTDIVLGVAAGASERFLIMYRTY